MKDPRNIAYNLIVDWEKEHSFPNLSLKSALRTVADARDKRFITALLYGVIERKITLDHFIAQCCDRPISRLSVPVLSALRMGFYQSFYMDVPVSAACNTSVELVKKNGHPHSSGFVNAVLRNGCNRKEELLKLKKADFSVRYSIDPSLVELLLSQYGKESFVSMMEAIRRPETVIYLFHNRKRGEEKEFMDRMNNEGIHVEPTEIPHLFRADGGFSVEDSGAYREGWFHVIGRHSAETALLMPLDASKVMDLCAAPGGKSFVMASVTDGKVYSFDIHPHKIKNLKNAAERLRHDNVYVTLADATVLMTDHIGTADFVLCDVPCSGLGMIGKKPDIKYKTYADSDFTDTQFKILKNGGSYVKPGRKLVYSTCTIDRRENEILVQRFLESDPTFKLEWQKTYLPDESQEGFYIALLRKDLTIEN